MSHIWPNSATSCLTISVVEHRTVKLKVWGSTYRREIRFLFIPGSWITHNVFQFSTTRIEIYYLSLFINHLFVRMYCDIWFWHQWVKQPPQLCTEWRELWRKIRIVSSRKFAKRRLRMLPQSKRGINKETFFSPFPSRFSIQGSSSTRQNSWQVLWCHGCFDLLNQTGQRQKEKLLYWLQLLKTLLDYFSLLRTNTVTYIHIKYSKNLAFYIPQYFLALGRRLSNIL